ncbi:hypothetical protein QBC34DRAFT_399154 [Podospora aff. communis PSN243]|uniref:DUF1917-domain-containing protein n=1 Tax=Podospora aff. communis PSN243 TaxID=3040156 RepID=A0AAV9GXE4_9PEZI|nr:hypothetical protein QBC34DRAFT_399154 [Podospora aff. communis PSN243]
MDSDSDFYGDEETIKTLTYRINSFDPDTWFSSPSSQLSLFTKRSNPLEESPASGRLHNRCASLPGARQLSESVSDFLTRLPPATTLWTPGFEWLWIANPYIPPDDHPEDHDLFISGGTIRLRLLWDFMQQAKKSGRSPFIVNKEISKERSAAIQDLRDLAANSNVLSGKWMLFPEPGRVNEVWEAVAHATAKNELGIVAKVETKGAVEKKERLICVYTYDFRDKDDVARVLNRLRQLELVRPGGRQVYYKCDAWTEIGIYGGNEWNISASMYSSNEIFAYLKEKANR